MNPDAVSRPFERLILTRRGRILTITLNRPDSLNAFDALLHTELPAAIEAATADPESDVVVLTGAGRAFSAGGDIGWQQDAADQPRTFDTTMREAKDIILGILDCPKPIIAKINGPAVGLGATVALFCDIIFIARSTYISDPHVSIGMVAGDGGAIIWPQLIGYASAKEFLLTGDRVPAADAHRMGLVNHVIDDAGLDAAVDGFADRLAAGAQMAIRYSKLAVNAPLKTLVTSFMDLGLRYEAHTNTSGDHHEALAAFRERRDPVFGASGDVRGLRP